MYTYRKKPIEVEAFQMTFDRRYDNSEWPEWLHRAWNYEPSDLGSVYCVDEDGLVGPGDQLWITTLEGALSISFDDWIIKGVIGEIYPCKPDVFAATYDVV